MTNAHKQFHACHPLENLLHKDFLTANKKRLMSENILTLIAFNYESNVFNDIESSAFGKLILILCRIGGNKFRRCL